MKGIATTVTEALTLTVLGALIGFSANHLRQKDALDPHKNYFDFSLKNSTVSPPPGGAPARTAQPSDPTAKRPDSPPGDDASFPTVSFAQVEEYFSDPATGEGMIVFVDARHDDQYAEGHIPNAILCDGYDIDNYIDAVRPQIEGATKVIIYCSGGDCDASKRLFTDLVQDFEVPIEKLAIFTGGLNEWKSRDMPVESGDEGGAQ